MPHDTPTTEPPITIRPVQANDTALLVDLFHQLSPETRRLRFHASLENVPEELIWRNADLVTHFDPRLEMAFVALNDAGEVLAIARYKRTNESNTQAEIGVLVRDADQQKGIGSKLLVRLVEFARQQGIEQFVGWVLPENATMLSIVRHAELPFEVHHYAGEIEVVMNLSNEVNP